jgi:hypothetical protein
MSEETQDQQAPVEAPAEEGLKFDPKEVEAQLVKMAQERSEDPVETASSAYRMYLPYFKAQLPKLSTRALRRLIEFCVMYPLEKSKPGSTTAVEREMMELTNTLIQAKFVMILATYNEHAEQLYNAANTPLTEEEAAQVIADLKAGGASDEDIAAIHKKTVDNTTEATVE